MSNGARRHGGPMGHGKGMTGEKAKNFKGAMLRLLKYMERYKGRLILMVFFAYLILSDRRSLEKQLRNYIPVLYQKSVEEAESILRRLPGFWQVYCVCILSVPYFLLSRDIL